MPIKTTAPPIKLKRWVNKRTQQEHMVPEGIDPGWDTNPGIARRQNLEAMMRDKLDAADPDLRRVAEADLKARLRHEE